MGIGSKSKINSHCCLEHIELALAVSHQIRTGGGLTALLGVSRVGATSMLGGSSLLMPSATTLLARARLNSLLLQAN